MNDTTELGQIRQLLRGVYRRWLLHVSGRWLFTGMGVVSGLFWLLVLVDELAGLPVAARVVVWIALALVTAAAAGALITRWFGRVPHGKQATELEDFAPELREQLLTAIEASDEPERNRLGYSNWLYEHTVSEARLRLASMDLRKFWRRAGLKQGLRWCVAGIALSLCLGLIFPAASGRTLFALTHPTKEIPRPEPFEWTVTDGAKRVLQYEDVTLTARTEGSLPAESARLHWRYTTSDDWFSEEVTADSDHSFSHTLTALPRSITYRFEAVERSSAEYDVVVMRRPELTLITASCAPPAYTGIDPFELPAPQKRWIVPEGSRITLVAQSDRPLASGYLSFADSAQKPLVIAGLTGQATWTVNRGQTVRVFVIDTSGYTNFDPVPVDIETIPDLAPQIAILKPGGDLDIPEAMVVQMTCALLDDYGLSNIDMIYRVVGQDGERAEKTFALRLPAGFGKEGVFEYTWSLFDLRLFPGDRVIYKARVYDNHVPEPKWAETKTYVLRFPTLDEIIAETERNQGRRTDQLSDAVREQRRLAEDLRDMSRQLVGKKKVEWENRQQLEQALSSQQQLSEQLKEWAEDIEKEADKLAKNRLSALELTQKMNEIARLLEEVMTDELRKAMEKLQEAMDAMTPEEMQQALEEFEMTQEEILAQLERTLAQLKQMQLEQMMEDMMRLAEQLAEDQEQQNAGNDAATDQTTLDSLAREQQALVEELKDLKEKARELVKKSEEYGGRPEMKEFSENVSESQAGQSMEAMASEMQHGDQSEAANSGEAAGKQLRDMLAEMQKSMMNMRNQMNAEQLADLQNLTRKALELSVEQESMGNIAAGLSHQSLALRDQTARQMAMSEGIRTIREEFDRQAKENLFLSPDVRRHLKDAQHKARQAIGTLSSRNGPASQGLQYEAMFSLNQASQSLMESMQNQSQCQGQSPGQSEMQGGMQGMAQQQQQLNQQSQGMRNPFGMTPEQREGVKRLAAQQEGIRRQMNDLGNQFARDRERLGRFEEMSKSMDEIIADMQLGELSDETLERQRKVYNRMLDFQKSLQRQDFEDRRQSRSGVDIVGRVPDPVDHSKKDPRNDAARWEEFRNEWYPPGFRALVKEYFETVSRRNSSSP